MASPAAPIVRFLRDHFGLVVALAALGQLIVCFVRTPACLSIDEVTHRWMARDLKAGTLFIQNGFEQIASSELESLSIRALRGHLVSEYPYGMELLAWPLHALVGFRAFFVLNTAAFFGTVLLCHSIARRVLGSRGAALTAAGIFAFATYAWEYSVAAWPHASTTFLATAAFHQVLLATDGEGRRDATARCFAAGLFAGVAATMRLDGVFIVAPLLLFVALSAEAWVKRAAVVLLGTLPGLAILAVTNHVKFGAWAPLSYGPWESGGSPTSGVVAYLPLALAAAAGLALVVYAPPRLRGMRAPGVAALVAALLAVALAVPSVRRAAAHTFDGLWMLVVDLRHSDATVREPALERSARGAMTYFGSFKKAWLQSLPYLPVALLAITARVRDRIRRRRLLAVGATVATYVFAFSYFRWHGGMSLNLRYFLPALPFLSILVAEGLRRLVRRATPAMHVLRWADMVVLGTVLAYFVVLFTVRPQIAAAALQERFYLDAPLVLAALLGIALLASYLVGDRAFACHAAGASLVLALVAVAWASMTAFTYDALATHRLRAQHRYVAAVTRPYVPAHSLVVADLGDALSELLADDVILADGTRDGFADVTKLVGALACDGRAARAVVRHAGWDALRRTLDARVTLALLHEDGDLVVASLVPSPALCALHAE